MKKNLMISALILSLICASSSIFAADDTAPSESGVNKYGIFTYTVKGQSVTITNADDTDGKVTIPDTIDGKTVTELAEGAFGASAHITEVDLPDTITKIGNTCFAYSTSIKSVKLSKALTAIPQGAFYQCTALIGITIPYGVKTIAGKAFAQCPNLSSVSVASTVTEIAEDAFDESPGVKFYCKLSDSPYGVTYAEAHGINYENLITVYLNEYEVDFDQAPITDNKRFRTLVPLRSVLEDMGAEIEWYDDMNYAGVNIGGFRILIKPDSDFMRVNDATVFLSSPAIEYNNRILLPIRDVVQAVGGKVVWNENSTAIWITYNN